MWKPALLLALTCYYCNVNYQSLPKRLRIFLEDSPCFWIESAAASWERLKVAASGKLCTTDALSGTADVACPSHKYVSLNLAKERCPPMRFQDPYRQARLDFFDVSVKASVAVRRGFSALGHEDTSQLNREPSVSTRYREGYFEGFSHPLQFPYWWLPGLTARPTWPRKTFAWIEDFEKQHSEILQEFLQINQQDGISDFNVPEHAWPTDYGQPHKGWKTFHLVDQMGGRIEENIAKAPKTWALLQSVPRVSLNSMAMFSICMPGSGGISHTGYSNFLLRVHFTLVNRRPNLTFIQVADQRLHWHEGRVMVFDDTFWHYFWNHGDTPRVVLFFDVWHPDISDSELPAIRAAFQRATADKRLVDLQQEMQHIERASKTEHITMM